MKAKFFYWYNALAASLLSLLGFSSCGENGPWGDEPVLYGTPSIAFEAKGNITAEDGTPVEGIKAIIAGCRQSSYTGKVAIPARCIILISTLLTLTKMVTTR